MGDMTSTVYPVSGGLEDWAYGAGWDKASDATMNKCTPKSYPLQESFFSQTSLDHISTAIYLIEMDDSKNPPENSYGQRNVVTLVSKDKFTELASVLSNESKFNGHINRNIRVQLALIDMAKPYIQITKVNQLKSG